MDHQHIHRLFEKYLNNSCTPEEAEEFIHLLQSGEARASIEQLIEKHLQSSHEAHADDATIIRVFERLNLGKREKRHTKTLSLYLAAAAAVVIAIVTGTFHYYRQSTRLDVTTTLAKHDVLPGGNRAVLKFEGGPTIDLSSDQEGIVVSENQIVYTDGTDIIEQRTADKKQNVMPEYAILTTPKGGQYHITLSDGSKVWLNAASTLRYPLHFTEDKRIVELEGEAYFEVSSNRRLSAANEKIPFIVRTPTQEVEALGTQFNVNAYPDERTANTTLLEGSVRVALIEQGKRSIILYPGQQSMASIANGITVAHVDVETAVDWMAGDFIFADEDLKSIMRKVARWYDVAVVYKHNLPNDRYTAHISRSKNLSEVLRILELSGGLASEIENNTLFLSPPR